MKVKVGGQFNYFRVTYQQNMAELDDGKWMAKTSEFVTLLANFIKIAVRQCVDIDQFTPRDNSNVYWLLIVTAVNWKDRVRAPN